ncbi:MAG: CutA1 divalent ion tolerance protein [Deltaproteobacteria bacterium]|jgi:periplasmic divalent cation tolerance protein|nr:CutA1 divalent ion tolerance protein [Deltaproteobacteria bacterium]
MTEYCVVLVTVGSAEEGQRIAQALVGERLAACVSVVGPLSSTYRWQGEIVHEQERLLMIKTRAALFGEIERRVTQLHSYTTPEVIAVPVTVGSTGYLDWLRAETQPH